MPAIGDKKIDAVHDFFDLAYRTAKNLEWSPKIYALIITGIISGILFVLYRYWPQFLKVLRKYQEPNYLLLLFFVVFILTAIILDLIIAVPKFLAMLEKLLEMNAALALCLFLISLPPLHMIAQDYNG